MPAVASAEVLPSEVVQLVLQHVGLRERLEQCILACSSWHTAANAATTTIDVDVKANSSLPSWLDEYGHFVQHLTLSPHASLLQPRTPWVRYVQRQAVPMLEFPFQQLSNLRSLDLTEFAVDSNSCTAVGAAPPVAASSSGMSCSTAAGKAPGNSQRPNSLAALTKLTSLQLTNVSISLTPLSALSSLQHLKVAYVTDSSGADINIVLQSALQQLLQLTHLEIRFQVGDAALAPVRHLQQLQHLILKPPPTCGRFKPGRVVTAASFAALPSSLTFLQVSEPVGDAQRSMVLSSSNTPGLCQLTGLQQLRLTWQTIEPAVLSSMPQLRQLKLKFCKLVGSAAGTAGLLGVLPNLTQLQHLDLCGTMCDWGQEHFAADAAAYAALTASTQLTHINLCDCALAPGASKHVFPAGRSSSSPLRYLAVSIQHQLDSKEVGRVLSCLPNLADVNLDCGEELNMFDPALRAQLPGCLGQLSQLTCLKRLSLVCLPVDDDMAVRYLAPLTGLQELLVGGGVTPRGLLALTVLEQLCALTIYSMEEAGLCSDYTFDSTAPEGCPPNVWEQVLKEWQEVGWIAK